MKYGKRILSFILILALLVGLVPVGKDNVKEAEASEQYPSVPDTVIADADELYSGQGMKLFFPDVIEVPKGTYGDTVVEQDKLIAVFYKNTTHARFDQDGDGAADDKFPYGELHMAESFDNGETWTQIEDAIVTKDKLQAWGIYAKDEQGNVALDTAGQPKYYEARDPDLTLLDDGTLLLSFFVMNASHDMSDVQVYILESSDGGTTWSDKAPVKLEAPGLNYVNISRRGGMTQLSDGSIIIPICGYKADDSLNSAVATVRGTRDAQGNWTFDQAKEIIDTKGACDREGVTYGSANTPYVNEASCVATADDTLYLFMRQTGYVYKSVDKGVNWTYLTKENYPVGTQINQPGLELLSDGSIYVTYAIPATTYGRPVYGKRVVLNTEAEADGWNATTAELIYRSPESTSECGDPSSVPLDADGDGNTDKMLVVYYDGAENYIGGTFVDVTGNEVAQDTYTELSLKDFGVPTVRKFSNDQGTVIQTDNANEEGISLDGVAITGIYNISETLGYNSRVIFGGSYSGIKIAASYNGNLYVDYYDQTQPEKTNDSSSEKYHPQTLTITPAQVDGESLLGRDIKIKVSFKYQSVSDDGTSADVLFGITVEDTYSTYMVFEDMNTTFLKQTIGIHATEASPITMTEPSFGELEELTLEDFGVPTTVQFENADHKVIQTVTPDASLDGKMVTGTYNFSTTSGTNILVFGSSWFGVWVYAYEAYLNVYFYGYDASAGSYVNIPGAQITPAMVDGKSLLGRELNIKMCFDLENPVGDDVDVTCGIIVNDACYETMEFSSVAASNFKQAIGVTAPAGCPMVLKGNAEQLSLENYGIPKKITFEGVEGKVIQTATPNEGLNGKIISGTFNFYNAAATNKAVLGSAWNGLWLMPSGDNLYGYYYDSSGVTSGQFSITPSEVDGKALPGRDLKMQVYFNYGEIVDDKADLQVVFIIEGIYAKSLIFDDVKVTDLKQRIGIHAPSGYPLVLTGEAEELTLKDFGIQTAKKYGNESHTLIATSTPNETLNGKMISGIYNFYNVSGTNTLGIGSNWYGIWLMPSGDNLYGYYYDESGTQYSAFTITPSEVDGKALPGRDLKLQVYFNYGNVENNRANVLATFIVEDIFVKSVLFENVSIANIGEKLGITNNGYPFTLIEPSAYPNCYYPQALGATLATNADNEDVVRMGFNFADVIEIYGLTKDNIEVYGGVVVAGTKDAATMQTKAEAMISGALSESEGYKRTEKSGDAIARLVESDDPTYYITITNSGTLENIAKRATAIGYIKTTDGTIYYTTQCEGADNQAVNRSVYGLLKKIFEVNYVADYDAANVKEDTILYKAVAKYIAKEGAVETTAEGVKTIVTSSDKSTEDTRKILSGVHYAIPELWDGANAALKGKYISILGHSIDSYAGVSNDTSANTTIGNNSCTYPNTFSLTQGDMWWSQVIKDKGMNLLVCNASSGAAVSYDTGDGGIIKKGSDDARALQLHDDNGENEGKNPDIIAVTLGINDFRSGQGIGTFDASAWNTICQTKEYPVSAVFADNYAIMLDKITTKYPDAEVFVFNIFESNETLCNTRTNLEEYNEMIATIAAYFGVTVVDAYNDTGINKANASDYAFDGLHFNALGMKKYANAFEIALMEKYAQ